MQHLGRPNDAYQHTTLNTASVHTFDAEAALHALDDGYCLISTEWRVLFANVAIARIFGGELAAYVGQYAWEAFPPLADAAAETLRATMRDGQPRTCRASVLAGTAGRLPDDQRWYDIRVTCAPQTGLALQFRDVSATVRAEGELRERNDENEALRDIVCALAEEADLDALLRLICTKAATQCHGAGAMVLELDRTYAVAVAATGIFEPFCGRSFPRSSTLTERALEARAPVRVDEDLPELRDVPDSEDLGRSRVGPVLLAPLAAHGAMLGVLGVARPKEMAPFTDTEVKRIRVVADQAALALWKTRLFEQAQAANRTKSEFMATMSHELRTPLTALTGYQELMADEILGPLSEEQRTALERMRWSTQLLTTIVEEILIYSKLEAGEVTAQLQPTTLQDVLSTVAAVLEPLASARNLALGIRLPPEPVVVTTDPTILWRVLVNLGANAVKFTDHGEIEFIVDPREAMVRLAIRDTGIGIAREDQDRLFQPFTQLQGGMTRRHGGTGLGLYTAWRLLHLIGGTIEVHSEPGVGSTFTVVIPREAGRGEPGEE